ncbi:hypothetical protein N7474_005152 [Penicillium riverlandense]|uniref:uncharacterized protein n=1 Tax=Penicillium riverlandense TaxID=1903569 RepID=UPI0025484F06|nr:uncharacterized protein N7474_005152 [Penicillium riverlandense]KAJ5819561.1 hypothetical protein N7474_005152 [Penicillium riverlandense]
MATTTPAAAAASSCDTLITPPSQARITIPCSKTMDDSDLELSALKPTPPQPIVANLLREASDLTWSESFKSTKDTVILVRRGGRFRLWRQQQFKNSLLAGVGYLELANAGDFAANVWNQIPVPRFAAVLMGIGGAFALGMALVAVRDFRLSWQNVKLLRTERGYLQRLRVYHDRNPDLVSLLDCRLGVGVRELGTEAVDRLVMDMLMGAGSVLVGIGTLMAIGGANHRVYKASNLLSGYIGNALAAIFGLVNAIWSAYLLHRFRVHDAAVLAQKPSDTIRRRLQVRSSRFKWHAFVSGLNGLVAGAASMVTAERWWGYIVLIPCIVSLILCNFFWRKKLGYDRPVLGDSSPASMQLTPLFEDLEYTIALQRALADAEISSPQNIVQTDSLESILQFIARNGMLEQYGESLALDKNTCGILSECTRRGPFGDKILMSPTLLLALSTSPTRSQILLDHAKRFLVTDGYITFVHRERHLLELLGYAAWRDQTTSTSTPHQHQHSNPHERPQ